MRAIKTAWGFVSVPAFLLVAVALAVGSADESWKQVGAGVWLLCTVGWCGFRIWSLGRSAGNSSAGRPEPRMAHSERMEGPQSPPVDGGWKSEDSSPALESQTTSAAHQHQEKPSAASSESAVPRTVANQSRTSVSTEAGRSLRNSLSSVGHSKKVGVVALVVLALIVIVNSQQTKTEDAKRELESMVRGFEAVRAELVRSDPLVAPLLDRIIADVRPDERHATLHVAGLRGKIQSFEATRKDNPQMTEFFVVRLKKALKLWEIIETAQ